MTNTIQHRRSISGGAVPSAGQLVNTGELFVNTADEKLYVSKGGGTAFVLTPGGAMTWEYIVANWSTEPTLNSAISGGEVYDYTLNGTTRYRFVPTTYDPTEDAFYETFSAGTLSNLIVTRG